MVPKWSQEFRLGLCGANAEPGQDNEQKLGSQAQTAELSGLSASAAAADSVMLSCWLRNSLDVYLMAIMRAVVIAAPITSVQATARPSGA